MRTKNKKNNWDEVYKKGGIFDYYDMLKPHPDMDRIIKIFKKNKISKVLDLGCGLGNNLIPLLIEGFEASGIDMSQDAIKKLKMNLKKIKKTSKLKVGLLQNLPYKDNDFDAIVCVQTLAHGKTAEVKKAVSEMTRVLKKGGFIFLTLTGRTANGEVRYCLVKTAKRVQGRVYVPTIGAEIGIPHFIFDKSTIRKMFGAYKILEIGRDYHDYYSVLAVKK